MSETRESQHKTSPGFESQIVLNEYSPITWIALHHAKDAYQDQGRLNTLWQPEGFIGLPNIDQALEQYERFLEPLRATGARLDFVPAEEGAGISAIYCRDSSILTSKGVLLGNMKNACRRGEPGVMNDYFRQLDIPIVGAIEGDGNLEGGDFVWFDEHHCAVAHGYRTNAAGIRQMRRILGDGVHVEVVPLPHYHGAEECLHLMSIISPVDADLAVVYSPLMPVPFRNWLISRGIQLVEVPDEEFEPTMGCNVLAIGPPQPLIEISDAA